MEYLLKEFNLKFFFKFLFVFLGYYVLARTGLLLSTINDNISPIWPASGLAIGALILGGPKYVVAVAMGAFTANLHTGAPLWVVGFISFGNAFEAYLAGFIFKKIGPLSEKFVFHSESFRLITSCFISCLPAALIGVSSLYVAQVIPGSALTNSILTWWSGDLVGALILLPIILETAKNKKIEWKLKLDIPIFTVMLFVFLSFYLLVINTNKVYLFLILPALLAMTFNNSLKVSLYGVLAFSIFSILGVLTKHGPHQGALALQNLISMQLFLAGVIISNLLIHGHKKKVSLDSLVLYFMVGWIISTGVFYALSKWEKHQERDLFEEHVHKAILNLQTHSIVYENALRAGAGLFLASDKVDSEEWRIFASTLKLEERFEGINGIGYIQEVEKTKVEKQKFLEDEKKYNPDLNLEIKIVPGGDQFNRIHYLIKYIEPLYKNVQALGLDVGSEINRRVGAEIAKSSGKYTFTGPIVLVQDNEKGPGFLAFYPVFKQKKSEDEFIGWIYAPFIMKKFFGKGFGDSLNLVDVIVSDVTQRQDSAILFSSNSQFSPSKSEMNFEINLGGRIYMTQWRRGDLLLRSVNTYPELLAFLSLLLVMFFAGSIANHQYLTDQANILAIDKNRKLRITLLVNEILNSELSIEKKIHSIIMSIRKEFNFSIAGYWKWNEENEYLQFQTYDLKDNIDLNCKFLVDSERIIFKLGEGLPGRSIKENKCIVMTNELCDCELNFRSQSALLIGLKNGYAFPIVFDNEKFGVMEFYTMSDFYMDEELVDTLCNISFKIASSMNFSKIKRENDLHQLKLLESSKMSALGEMSAGVAHEINNPLTIIRGKASVMSSRILKSEFDSEYFLKSIETVITAVDRISKIIKSLQKFSRNASQDPFRLCSVQQIFDDTVELVKDRFQTNKIKFDYPTGLNTQIECHEGEIVQTLLNLLNNSFDAIFNSNSPWIKLGFKDCGDMIEITVTDSGLGLSEEIQEKIMQPFFTTKEIGKGTGLGMSVSQGIARSHNGDLIYNRQSANTEFILTLPKRHS